MTLALLPGAAGSEGPGFPDGSAKQAGLRRCHRGPRKLRHHLLRRPWEDGGTAAGRRAHRPAAKGLRPPPTGRPETAEDVPLDRRTLSLAPLLFECHFHNVFCLPFTV